MINRHVLILVSAALAAGSALAAEAPTAPAAEPATGLDYVLRAGATYSDNIGLQPSPYDESASSLTFGAELHGKQTTGRLRYDAAMELWRYQYLSYYSGGDTFGRGLIERFVRLLPGTLPLECQRQFRPVARRRISTNRSGKRRERDHAFHRTHAARQIVRRGGHRHWMPISSRRSILATPSTTRPLAVGWCSAIGPGRQSNLGLGGSIDDVTYLGGYDEQCCSTSSAGKRSCMAT